MANRTLTFAASAISLTLVQAVAGFVDLLVFDNIFGALESRGMFQIGILIASLLCAGALPKLNTAPYTRLAKVGILMLVCLGAFFVGIIVGFAPSGGDGVLIRISLNFTFWYFPGALIAMLGGGVIGAFVFRKDGFRHRP